MAKAIHMMVRVMDEKKSVAFYETAFGLRSRIASPSRASPSSISRTTRMISKSSSPSITDATEPYTHGTGYGHLALSVGDADTEHERLDKAGMSPTPVKEFHRDGALLAKFFFVTDPDGYKIEVLQRHGRYT